jgi:subtilase family serine protease
MMTRMARAFCFSAVCLIVGSSFGTATLAASAAPGARALIVDPLDERSLVTISGNLRPEASSFNDQGLVADDLPMAHMQLLLRRSAEREQALDTLIEQMHNPASPEFHHWLTPQEFGAQFGAASSDITAVEQWLASHGLTVNSVYPNGLVIDFSGTARQVRQAFHTEIHHLLVNGEHHIANMSEPQIPAALEQAVVGVISLHDFKPRMMHKARKEFTFTSGGSTFQALVPADLATIYNLNPLFAAGISGQGQTIVVIEDSDVFSTADVSTFRSTFGLSSFTSGSFTQTHPAPKTGTNNCADPGVLVGNDGEATLDAEWASAAAPSAAIVLASCKDTTTTFGGLIAIQNLLNASSTPPAIMSISFGECEAFNGATANAAYTSTYQQAVAEGVSVFVSSGDEGAASCDANATRATHGIGVSGFASTPFNVAVGGTDFGDSFAGTNATFWSATNSSAFGSALSYVPEIPWNDSCASVLISTIEGFSATFGRTGFCNSSTGEADFLTTGSGSGGPSGCATGTPSTSGVVSGSCKGAAKPSWQVGILGNPADGVRDIPDVSLFAANGVWGHFYIFCYSNAAGGGAPCTGSPSGWAGAGGTSFSSPILAGIQALVNQHTAQRWGNPNPTYYSLANSEYGTSGSATCNSSKGNAVGASCVFYDTTQGDMDVNCTGTHSCFRPSGTNGVLSTSTTAYKPAFTTGTGWDFATGIGTVNAFNLVMSWP